MHEGGYMIGLTYLVVVTPRTDLERSESDDRSVIGNLTDPN